MTYSQNIEAEIVFFNKIAETGGHLDSFSEAGYRQIFHEIKKYIKGHILDAGCGTGAFGKRLRMLMPGSKLDGIDLNPAFVKASIKAKTYNSVRCGNLEDQNLYRPEHFDTIVCPYLLHHLPDMHRAIDNFSNWLKPGGHLIIIDPNGSNLILRLSYLFRMIISSVKKDNDYGSVNEAHKTVREFTACMKNFQVIKITSFQHSSVTVPTSFSWTFLGILGSIRRGLILGYKLIPGIKYPDSDLIIIARKK